MKNVQKIDLGLTGYDELFMNDAERKENKLPRIYDVPISEIDDFPDHPFKVKVDEDITRVKCRKCKFNEVIDTALFRTVRPRRTYRVKASSRHNPLR